MRSLLGLAAAAATFLAVTQWLEAQLKAAKDSALDLLPDKDFQLLNRMKRNGFYIHIDHEKFVCQRELVGPTLSKAVYNFASAAAVAMAAVLSGENLERYFNMAASIRSKSTEQSHQRAELLGRQLAEFFASEENRSDKPKPERPQTLKVQQGCGRRIS